MTTTIQPTRAKTNATKGVPMDSLRKTALVAGVLYVITFVSIPTLVLYGPVLGDPNYIVGPGPDTAVIIGAILEPNREVREGYIAHEVVTKTGQSYQGYILAETPTELCWHFPDGRCGIVQSPLAASQPSSARASLPPGKHPPSTTSPFSRHGKPHADRGSSRLQSRRSCQRSWSPQGEWNLVRPACCCQTVRPCRAMNAPHRSPRFPG